MFRLIDAFGLDLSLLGRLGGHSFPRTHRYTFVSVPFLELTSIIRGKERFPGMTITYALMEKYEDICSKVRFTVFAGFWFFECFG